MKLSKLIENRRSIRKFKTDKISDTIILELLESARLAPSAKNIQPWRFYVARNEKKDKIADIMEEYYQAHPDKIGMHTTAIAIKQSAAIILVFKQSEHSLDRNDTLSIGAAIEHILLTATDLGLGSLWICATYAVRDKISKLIGTELELYSAIALGYPNENPTARPRKSMEEILLGLDN